MDISDTLAPKSDQLDAVDMAASGPRVFTVARVSKGDAEQPVNVHLAEFARGPWRPGKNQRRVLASCWGNDASAWVGRRVELYCDPTVMFGKEAVGGIKIKRLSDIDGPQTVPIIVSRGKGGSYTVQPLAAAATDRDAGASGGAPAERSLADAIREQSAKFTDDERARLRQVCDSLPIPFTGKAFIAQWGERARDLMACVREIEQALSDEASA
jgi:hypothetical protein